MRILSNIQEGELVQFGPLDGKEFGILIQRIFFDCNQRGLSKGYSIRCSVRYLIGLNDAHLKVIFRETEK